MVLEVALVVVYNIHGRCCRIKRRRCFVPTMLSTIFERARTRCDTDACVRATHKRAHTFALLVRACSHAFMLLQLCCDFLRARSLAPLGPLVTRASERAQGKVPQQTLCSRDNRRAQCTRMSAREISTLAFFLNPKFPRAGNIHIRTSNTRSDFPKSLNCSRCAYSVT